LAIEIVRAVSACRGPRSKAMHVLNIENTALSSETQGFEVKTVLEKDIRKWVYLEKFPGKHIEHPVF